MITQADIEDAIKSQKIRLFDTYALGPFMLWYAYKSKGMGKWPRRALFISGFYTVIYNWNNYRNIKANLAEKLKEIEAGNVSV